MSYPLEVIYFIQEECQFLWIKAFITYLPKIGFNRKFPINILYGPQKYEW